MYNQISTNAVTEIKALRDERNSLVRLVTDLRWALGDEGKRMQPEFLEHAKRSQKDAERYRKLRRGQHWSVVDGVGDMLRGDALDAAVDAVPAVGAA